MGLGAKDKKMQIGHTGTQGSVTPQRGFCFCPVVSQHRDKCQDSPPFLNDSIVTPRLTAATHYAQA